LTIKSKITANSRLVNECFYVPLMHLNKLLVCYKFIGTTDSATFYKSIKTILPAVRSVDIRFPVGRGKGWQSCDLIESLLFSACFSLTIVFDELNNSSISHWSCSLNRQRSQAFSLCVLQNNVIFSSGWCTQW